MDTTGQKLTETQAQRTFYQSDTETLPEDDEESLEECLFLDLEEEKAMLEEVDAFDLGESEAELVLAELQSQGKEENVVPEQGSEATASHGSTARHEARATKQADNRSAEACHQMWTMWSTWSLAQGLHQS